MMLDIIQSHHNHTFLKKFQGYKQLKIIRKKTLQDIKNQFKIRLTDRAECILGTDYRADSARVVESGTDHCYRIGFKSAK